MIPRARSNGRARRLAACCLLASALAGVHPTTVRAATEGTAESSAAVASHPASRQHRPRGLEDRVELMARELDLDSGQRIALRKILEEQRVQVARVWDDASVPGAIRVSTTQAISDRTADQIRALLNDEQRKKYIQPRHRDTAVGTPGGRVESWMNPGKPS